MQENKAKIFRLAKPDLFKLEKGKLYLATETPVGYVVKIDDYTRIGLPKKCVENNLKLFKPYNYRDHKDYNRNKRQRINQFPNDKKF